MIQIKKLFKQDILCYHQLEIAESEKFQPFALTDTFLNYTNETGQPIIHFWSMEKTLILGMKDTRLPNLNAGMQSVTDADYHLVARNAGGLAVVSDEGILNVSLIFKNPTQQKFSIAEGYELMLEWIRETFAPQNPESIQAFEVVDSYCPGDYDLSIDGKKFAGIAQRRVKDSLAIMIYLSINGKQLARGELVRNFYQKALANTSVEIKNDYPQVNPQSMESLDVLLSQNLTMDEVIEKLGQTLIEENQVRLDQQKLKDYLASNEGQTIFQQNIQKIELRNNIL